MGRKCSSAIFSFRTWGSNQTTICNKPISLVDIYPTCIDLAEMTAPHVLDGDSIKPLLEDPINGEWTGNDYSVSGIASKYGYNVDSNGDYTSSFQSQYNNTKLPYTSAHFSIRTEQYRYIYYRNGEEELYDHVADPNELTNLAHPSVRQDFEDILVQMNLYSIFSWFSNTTRLLDLPFISLNLMTAKAFI